MGGTLNGIAVGTSSVDGVSDGGGADSAIAKANAINAVSSATGVTATAGATIVSGAASTAQVAIAGNTTDYIYVNGVKLGGIAAGCCSGNRPDPPPPGRSATLPLCRPPVPSIPPILGPLHGRIACGPASCCPAIQALGKGPGLKNG